MVGISANLVKTKCDDRMSSGLIIVVDDDPTFRKLYSDFLAVHGFAVMTARSGIRVQHRRPQPPSPPETRHSAKR